MDFNLCIRLASQCLDEDLHATAEKMKGGLFVVVEEGAAIFQLFIGKGESVLVWGMPSLS